MIRLPAIGAAVFALATLALPTFALPHKTPDKLTHLDTRSQLQDVNLAEVVTTAQAQGDGADGLPDHLVRRRDRRPTTPPTPPRRPTRRSSRSSTPTPPTGRTASPAGSDALQANVAIVQRFLSAQDGGTKGLRFDMGTNCGAAVRRHPGRPAAGRPRRLRRQLRRDLLRRAARPRRRRRPAQRGRPGRRPLGLHAGVRPRRDRHGHDGRAPGRRATSTTAAG